MEAEMASEARWSQEADVDNGLWAGAFTAALLVGLAGYLMAWVPHPSPALRIAGLDLGEYVKFLPEVRAGQMRIVRELFYLPLFAGSLALLFAAWWTKGWWRWPARAVGGVASLGVALLMLPPVWTPATLFRGEFQVQGIALLLCLVAALGSPALTIQKFRRAVSLPLASLCIAAATIPLAQFLWVHPALEKVYGSSLPVGPGAWLNLLGFSGAATQITIAWFRSQ